MDEDRILLALGGLLHDIGKFLFKAKEAKKSEDGNFELGVKTLDDKLDKLRKAKREERKYIYQDEYKYEHAYLSALIFEWLKSKNIITEEEKKKLINWGAKHHQPTDEVESVVCQIADWLSSSEREIVLGSCIGLMHSVFERVSLKPQKERKSDLKELKEWHIAELNCKKLIEEFSQKPMEPKKFGYYIPSELKIDGAIFPKLFDGKIFVAKGNADNKDVKKKKEEQRECQYLSSEDILIVPNKGDFEKAREQEKKYTNLFKNLLSELEKAKGLKGIQLFNYIYYLLYKYAWCVPASVFDREKGSRHYPDISLFDHSRVLSAMALSIYDWVKEKGLTSQEIKLKNIDNCWILPTDGEEVFLLVEGDIGGIQNFIYSIHKTSESELPIAKALRGRSFFLTMLPEVIARYILKELGYPITNALFIGGGKFQLLVGNTEKNRKRLEEIEDEVNKWFFDDFHGELSLSIATVKVRGCVFRQGGGETFLDKVEQLQLELDNKKKRRFKELIWQEEFKGDDVQIKAEAICNSCRSLPVVKDKLCQWCHKSQKWGEVLPKIKYIAFDFGEEKVKLEDRKIKIMEFGDFGKVYLLEEEDLPKVKDLPEILNIEDTEFKFEENKVVNGFKFIGHSAPKVSDGELAKALNDLWKKKKEQSGGSEREEGDLEVGHILPFELLAEFAEGDKKLGFFRADVDYLGLILSDGLRFNEFGTEEIYTISRIATLSRMLDLFFAGYLNKLAEEVSVEYVNKALKKYNSKDKLSDSEKERKKLLEMVYDQGQLKIVSLIYTVYSGGDDLFIIAPYDLAVEFALKLRKKFREYTCENPDFGISGGIHIGKHNTPIHLVAGFAEDLENTAKKARKVKDMIALFDKALAWNEEVEKWVNENKKGLAYCESKDQENPCKPSKNKSKYIDLSTAYNELVNKFIKWLEDKNNGVARALYYKLLDLHRSFVDDSIDPRIYPKIYYYVGRNVKDENVRKEMIETLLNGMNSRCDVDAVIRNLDVVLYLTLMKTRGGR